MAKRLFVGSLSYSVTSAQVEELFAQAGKIDSVNLITDKFSGQSKGFAFVEMATEEEAQEAIKKFNNYELDGRKIIVNEARPQENRSNRSDDNRSRSW
ncbi:MAG: RNA-binding protein [Candidatus Curtissbacteria bacterium]|nr:RNA-binding protein [Candidatus Curtissbacteria bacterium]